MQSNQSRRRTRGLLAGTALIGAGAVATPLALAGGSSAGSLRVTSGAASLASIERSSARIEDVSNSAQTTTPIKHVVVIFGENVSFDHYFGTYPNATNSSGEPFYAKPGTSSVNGLTPALLTANPNGLNPRRLDPTVTSDLLTCDQGHGYTQEQTAFDGGKMDRFTAAGGTATVTGLGPTGKPCAASDVMNYYDGNTVTAMWNYAQSYAVSDNFYGTTFGPSAPGAINVVSGNTGGVDTAHAVRGALTDGDTVGDGTGGQSLISDAQPYWDDCSNRDAVAMTGQNIGDLLNAKGLSWGWFEGGFAANTAYSGPADTASTYNQLNEPGRATCTTSHNVGAALGGTGTTGAKPYGVKADYIAHHEPFQFYASTANPHHLAPVSLSAVGTDTATPGEFNTANHQYDMSWFDQLVSAIHSGQMPSDSLPAVSYLKAPGYQDAHAAYSDPIDEQNWMVNEINSIEALPTWKSTAIFITYDDSDGFYDHAYSGVTNPSVTAAETLTAPAACGTESSTTVPLYNEQGRCGHGPRMPLVVISPFAKQNYVSHTLTDQSSIPAFIEQNWGLGQIAGSASNVAGSLDDLFDFSARPHLDDSRSVLNPMTGEPSTPVIGSISPSSGPVAGGTQVTISGFNLTSGREPTVLFGDDRATGVSCTASTTLAAPASTCTVTAPAHHSGATDITVEVGGAQAMNDAGSYTYQ
ncbi:MAG: phosphoesterase [Acidimicrobiaceae bacterium]|nr:phosphoesterase [Acidimicrobiaceae bacterium]